MVTIGITAKCFGWDLNGDYTTNGSLSTTPANGGSWGLKTQSGFSMPVDPGDGSLFKSQPVNTYANPLNVTSDSAIDVTSSGATTIFTGTLSIGDRTLSIVGGQNAPGSVQINGVVSLTGVAHSTFNVENNNVLTLAGLRQRQCRAEQDRQRHIDLGQLQHLHGPDDDQRRPP